jgi:hypothetical protein
MRILGTIVSGVILFSSCSKSNDPSIHASDAKLMGYSYFKNMCSDRYLLEIADSGLYTYHALPANSNIQPDKPTMDNPMPVRIIWRRIDQCRNIQVLNIVKTN